MSPTRSEMFSPIILISSRFRSKKRSPNNLRGCPGLFWLPDSRHFRLCNGATMDAGGEPRDAPCARVMRMNAADAEQRDCGRVGRRPRPCGK